MTVEELKIIDNFKDHFFNHRLDSDWTNNKFVLVEEIIKRHKPDSLCRIGTCLESHYRGSLCIEHYEEITS
jgi:hypothetical protein